MRALPFREPSRQTDVLDYRSRRIDEAPIHGPVSVAESPSLRSSCATIVS